MLLELDKKVAAAHMEATGWGINELSHANIFDSHFVYINDFRSNNLKLFSVAGSLLDSTNCEFAIETTTGALCNLLDHSFKSGLSADELSALYEAVIKYVQQTKSFRMWKVRASFGERLHAVLNIYPGSGKPTVRTFVMESKSIIIDAKYILEETLKVARHDGVMNPDWF